MTVNEYLKDCRHKTDLSQLKLATKLGFYTAQYVSNVERGMCKPPLKVLELWCDLVGAEKTKVKKYWVNEFSRKLDKSL